MNRTTRITATLIAAGAIALMATVALVQPLLARAQTLSMNIPFLDAGLIQASVIQAPAGGTLSINGTTSYNTTVAYQVNGDAGVFITGSSQFSGINGAAPTVPTYCEKGEYAIASSTKGAHDAGFFRTFNIAPGGCTFGTVSSDGGGCGALIPTISASGLDLTAGANTTTTCEFACCGN